MHVLSAAAAGKPVSWAAVAPVLVITACFVAYCLADIARHPAVRNLPRWAWVLICLASMPFGGIAYLLLGRSEDR